MLFCNIILEVTVCKEIEILSLIYLEEVQFIDFCSPQIVFAVHRYMRMATVQNSDEMPLKDLDQPLLIAVCKANQFNYTLGEQLGRSITKIKSKAKFLSCSETYQFFF